MPFIPHTAEDIRAMLASIGVDSVDALFEEIPPVLRDQRLDGLPPALDEMAVMRLARERAERDGNYSNFIGAGAYEHHIPAAVWQIATRGEFYSSYTPYQAEASQGTLQLLYEYQTMMASLLGMDVTNASLYDGASALAEAVLMAVRLHKGTRCLLMPRTVHPVWRRVVHSIVRSQHVELVEVPFDVSTGQTVLRALDETKVPGAALVIPQPNFFGALEPVDELTDWAHSRGMLAIAVVNPLSTAVLKPPGQWGRAGVDIAVGDGQPLGIPLSSGGPYFGFMGCRKEHVRQMPGRVVGATVDIDGRRGYTLTLQAREQHIRRSKATSNICTNQGLMVTAAAIYMAITGPAGLAAAARASHANASDLRERLAAIPNIECAFSGTMFHEFVLKLKTSTAAVLRALMAQGILGGLALRPHYPELGECLLVCVTETKTECDIARYAENMACIIGSKYETASCAISSAP